MNLDASAATVEAQRIAADLLEIGAVLLRPEAPFTWSSGLRAPLYCDNRLVMSHVPVRRRVTDGLEALVRAQDPEPEVVAGTATAGIPHAAWLAERLALPMVYVRSKAKGHGRENRIEGVLGEGQRVVVVEDLISTGGSSLAAVEAVREAGAQVTGAVAIFSYGLPEAAARFEASGVPLRTVTTLDVLLEAALRRGAIDEGAARLLRLWQRDPQAWSERQ